MAEAAGWALFLFAEPQALKTFQMGPLDAPCAVLFQQLKLNLV